MKQDRLNGLTIMSIENKRAKKKEGCTEEDLHIYNWKSKGLGLHVTLLCIWTNNNNNDEETNDKKQINVKNVTTIILINT